MLTQFIEREQLLDEFKTFLEQETGIVIDQDSDAVPYRGQSFAVLAFRSDSDDGAPDERIDVDSEVLALEAFSELLNRPDLERFSVVQFRGGADDQRELLRYDRRTSDQAW